MPAPNDGFAQVIALPSATPQARAQNADDAALDALGVRHELTPDGYAKVSHCWHQEYPVLVDHKGRRCTCKGCGAELDPYDVLEQVARRNAQVVDQRRRLRHEIARLSERKADLEREERNAKARIRSAKKRAGLSTRADGWPLCPACGEDALEDRVNPVPSPKGSLHCRACRRVTATRGRAA